MLPGMSVRNWINLRGLLAALCLWGACGRGAAVEVPGLFYGWGVTNLITTNSVSVVGPITRIVAGGFHALALRVDGTVAAWGDNTSGQTNIPPGVSNIVAISAGARHNLCLRSNGTVVAWGLNTSSQTNVPANLNGVMAVAAGADHSVALLTNGSVVTWGVSLALTNYPAGLTNIAAIAAGSTVTLALRSNGTVVAWGTAASSLTNLPAGLTNVAAISAGLNHCLAIRSNGTVIAWGDNAYGQAVVPPQLTNNAIAISAGWLHSLALRTDGTFLGWGLSTSGQTTSPAGVTNFTSFAAGNTLNLLVDLAPRFVSKPPATVTLPSGQGYTLSASVLSGSAFTARWFFNGTPISDATNTDFVVTDFNVTKAGIYSLIASNFVATTTTSSILRLSNAPNILVNGVVIGGGSVTRTNSATITMTATTNAYPRIHYTLNGIEPDFTSPQYTAPFVISNSATVRAVAYNPLVIDKAEAAPITVQVIPTYPLVIASPGGGVVRTPGPDVSTNSYLSNTLVTLTATNNVGWVFMYWTNAANGTNPETTVLMSQSNNVQAVFGTSLNLATNYPQGQVAADPPARPFPYGSSVTLSALPDPGSYFFGWAGLLTNFANPVTLTVTNATGLTALFASLQVDQVSLVTLSVNGGGGVQASPSRNVYTNGELVTLTAWNSSNRVFSYWSGDATGTTNPLAVTMNSSKLIYANYVPGVPTSQLPVFTVLPGGSSLSLGNNASLAALATGIGAISYQWRLNGVNVAGATGTQLTVTNLTPAKAGLYDVLASNSFGTTTSPAAPVALLALEMSPSLNGMLPLLVIDCAPGAEFQLQYSGDLRLTNWSLLAPLTVPAARSYFIDTSPIVPRRFYRLVPQ